MEIPSIGLTVKIMQGTDSAALAKGAGHFTSTSIWNGNVALAGHNRGVTNHFGKIHTLAAGNEIILTTALGFFTCHGVTAEQFIWAWLRSKVLEPRELRFESTTTF